MCRSIWLCSPLVCNRPKGADELAGKLNIPRDNDGWFRELNYNAEPNSTGRDGIYLAGVCQGPKDIPDTVAQASAAAAYVLGSIVGADRAGKPIPRSKKKRARPPGLNRAGEKRKSNGSSGKSEFDR